MGIQANVGPVPAPREVHRGVTGAGEIIRDQQALEARGVGIPYFQRSSTMRPSFSTAAEAGFTEIEPTTVTLIKS